MTSRSVSLDFQPSADDRATDFKAVEGSTGDHYNGYTLMVGAYAAVWVVLMAWIFFLWRKQAELGTRIDGLESAIERAERKLAGAASATATRTKKMATAGEAETETPA